MSAEHGASKGFIGWLTQFFTVDNFIDRSSHRLAVAQEQDASEPKRRAALMATGVLARAEVLNLADARMIVNNNPLLQLHLRVIPLIGKPFTIVTEQQVSGSAIPQVGDVINIKFDLADRYNVMVIKADDPQGQW